MRAGEVVFLRTSVGLNWNSVLAGEKKGSVRMWIVLLIVRMDVAVPMWVIERVVGKVGCGILRFGLDFGYASRLEWYLV